MSVKAKIFFKASVFVGRGEEVRAEHLDPVRGLLQRARVRPSLRLQGQDAVWGGLNRGLCQELSVSPKVSVV